MKNEFEECFKAAVLEHVSEQWSLPSASFARIHFSSTVFHKGRSSLKRCFVVPGNSYVTAAQVRTISVSRADKIAARNADSAFCFESTTTIRA